MRPHLPALLTALALLLPSAAPGQARVLDALDSAAPWSARPSDGVSLRIATDTGREGRASRALRLDFDFHGGGGYAVARRALPITFPPNYELSFWIRGDAPPNNLEIKLVDATGDNVWWVNRPDFHFPDRWTRVVLRKRHIEFAWGPLGDGPLTASAGVEFAITAGSGGRGTVWLDDFTITERPPVPAVPPAPVASASSSAGSAAAVLDGNTTTGWRSAAGDGMPWLQLDFGAPREFGGLVVTWDSASRATDYDVQLSDDARAWQTTDSVRGGAGPRDHLYLPEREARYARLRLLRGGTGGYAVREVAVQPIAWAASPTAFLFAVARDAPRGRWPRYLTDSTQVYWTVVGSAGDASEGLFGEDGRLEIARGGPSLEPFLQVDGRLLGWPDFTATTWLEDGDLPIPSVALSADSIPVALTVTAWSDGSAGRSALWARYRVTSSADTAVTARLLLALRPLQVNPPWQFLNVPGGFARVDSVWERDGVVRLNDSLRVVAVTRHDAFHATTLAQGGMAASLGAAHLPAATAAHDPHGFAEGVLAWDLTLPPGESAAVYVAVPLHADTPPIPASLDPGGAAARGAASLQSTERTWRREMDRVTVELPPSARDVARTLRTMQAYTLINQDGPALQPGSRSYERSWIRDGALTGAAMLRMGHTDDVRRFIEWYAGFQYPNGKVPCCVDRRGADPVPEHDSHGEFIYLIAEYTRLTGDTTLARRLWPNVRGAVAYMDSLRATRLTPEYDAPALRQFRGILPPSISHEGYSAKPMHSYWDDLFALRGYKDAAWLATLLGDTALAPVYAARRDTFRVDVMASYRAAMRVHRIDYLPGAADLGDFDATSTTIGVAPGGELGALPDSALRRTFDKYWEQFVARRDGRMEWTAYTPYELRVVGTFVRLGERQRANEALRWFMGHRRPADWNQWGEVVWKDPATPRFVGDIPHTWVGSDFTRSVLDMLAYEREADSALVVGAGVPASWVQEEPGIRVQGLRTWWGPLDLTMRRVRTTVRVTVDGGLRVPPGGVVLRSPLGRAPRAAFVNGRATPVSAAGDVVLRRLPAAVELRY